jgi:hypothetical protein
MHSGVRVHTAKATSCGERRARTLRRRQSCQGIYALIVGAVCPLCRIGGNADARCAVVLSAIKGIDCSAWRFAGSAASGIADARCAFVVSAIKGIDCSHEHGSPALPHRGQCGRQVCVRRQRHQGIDCSHEHGSPALPHRGHRGRQVCVRRQRHQGIDCSDHQRPSCAAPCRGTARVSNANRENVGWGLHEFGSARPV